MEESVGFPSAAFRVNHGYAVPSRCQHMEAIHRAFAIAGFTQMKENASWDVYYVCHGDAESSAYTKAARPGRTINQFPAFFTLTSDKNAMCEQQLTHWGRQGMMEHMLPCFLLPQHEDELRSFVKLHPAPHGHLFMAKPSRSCCGRNISIMHEENVLSGFSGYVQAYLESALLVHGRKFDLRIYAFVPSVNPLRVYVSTLGFARFSMLPYADPRSGGAAADLARHITNVHFQNAVDGYTVPSSSGDDMTHAQVSCCSDSRVDSLTCVCAARLQWSLEALLAYLDVEHAGAAEKIWTSIKRVAARSVAAMSTAAQSPTCGGCYHLLGFDIIVDRTNKARLIEINSSPGIGTGNPLVDGPLIGEILPDVWRMKGIDKRVWPPDAAAVHAACDCADVDPLGDDFTALLHMVSEYYYQGSFSLAWPSLEPERQARMPESRVYDLFRRVHKSLDWDRAFRPRKRFFDV
jgi:hypothetical protein